MDARVISNYKLTRQIGTGGMGVVYLGEHTVIDRKVAIKLLRSEFSGNESLVRRFFNEARAASTSKHPGIVEIEDVGFDEGQAFITMEYIDGVTLSKYVRRRGRLSQTEAISFARQIASALEVAHEQAIVHRDLKPSNVMVVTDANGKTTTKVFDFGIAKLFDENSSHTRTGVVIGTPLYMSPEQCKGAGEVDHRSDLYSLGCILYFMITGKRVFSGEGDGEIIAQHIFIEPPCPSSQAPVSPQLCEIVSKLLAKDPEDRFQSADALVHTLNRVLVDLGEEPPAKETPLKLPLTPAPLTASAVDSVPAAGTRPSISDTPAGQIYPLPVEEVDQPPTLMRKIARQGRWIAAGFAITVFVVIGLLSSESPSKEAQEDANVADEVGAERADKDLSPESPTTPEPPKDTATGIEPVKTKDLTVPAQGGTKSEVVAVKPVSSSETGKGKKPKKISETGKKPNRDNKGSNSDKNADKSGKSSKRSGKNGKRTGSRDDAKTNSKPKPKPSTGPKTFNPFE